MSGGLLQEGSVQTQDIKQTVHLPTFAPPGSSIGYPGQCLGYREPLARRGVKLGVSLPSDDAWCEFPQCEEGRVPWGRPHGLGKAEKLRMPPYLNRGHDQKSKGIHYLLLCNNITTSLAP